GWLQVSQTLFLGTPIAITTGTSMATLGDRMTAIFEGVPRDINANGQVVGYLNKPHSQYAVLWQDHQTTSLLGTLSAPDRSQAYAINDHGQVVGEAETSFIRGGLLVAR